MAKLKDSRKPGFFWADNRVIDEYGARVGVNGVAVYMCLARHASKDRSSYPSFAQIAAELGLSRSTVVRAIARLKDLGLIAVEEKRDRTGRRVANVYRLLDPPEPGLFDDAEDTPASVTGDMGQCHIDTGQCHTDTPASVTGDMGQCHIDTPLKRTIPREQYPDKQDPPAGAMKTEIHSPTNVPAASVTTSDLTPEWLSRLWCSRLARRNAFRRPQDTEHQAAEALRELIRYGVKAETIAAEIEDPARDRYEWLSQFRDRLKRNANVNGFRRETIAEKLRRISAAKEASDDEGR